MAKFLVVVLLFVFPFIALAQTVPSTAENPVRPVPKQVLAARHLTCGRMQLLQQRTGLTTNQIVDLYNSSGARFFGQFTSAVIASQRLGLEVPAVLAELRQSNLALALTKLGVDEGQARVVVRQSVCDMLAAEHVSGTESFCGSRN